MGMVKVTVYTTSTSQRELEFPTATGVTLLNLGESGGYCLEVVRRTPDHGPGGGKRVALFKSWVYAEVVDEVASEE